MAAIKPSMLVQVKQRRNCYLRALPWDGRLYSYRKHLGLSTKLKVETSNLASGHIMKIIRIGSQTDRHAHIYGEYSLM